MRLPKNRKPTTPGELIVEEFMKPLGLTQRAMAEHLGWTTTKLNQILTGKRAVTPETALCLADALGPSEQFWLNAQMAVDLYYARQSHRKRDRLPQLAC